VGKEFISEKQLNLRDRAEVLCTVGNKWKQGVSKGVFHYADCI
jgi:hypothetical protein